MFPGTQFFSTLFIYFLIIFYSAGAIYHNIPDTDTEDPSKRKCNEEEPDIHSIWKQQFVNALMVPPYFFFCRIYLQI
jgi:hypothetical protein